MDAQALFRAHATFVAAFLHRLGTPRADVDDLTQEVFLVAHRKGGYVPGPALPRTWLSAIALHVARGAKRVRNRRHARADEDALSRLVAVGDPARALEARRAVARVQRALDTLDLEHRAAFVLHELEGEGCESIAAAFGVPLGTIYSRLHHARRRFTDAHAALSHDDSSALSPRLARGT